MNIPPRLPHPAKVAAVEADLATRVLRHAVMQLAPDEPGDRCIYCDEKYPDPREACPDRVMEARR